MVINRQLNYLFETDLGFKFENRGYIYGSEKDREIAHILSGIPGVEEVLTGYSLLLPYKGGHIWLFSVNEGSEKEKNMKVEALTFSVEYMQYYGLRLLEDSFPEKADEVLINEAFVKNAGWNNAIGSTVMGERYRVVGVLKDVYNESPLTPPRPVVYCFPGVLDTYNNFALFRYGTGEWKAVRARLESIFHETYDPKDIEISGSEEAYREYIRSEQMLLGVLSVVSLACVVISLFSVYSLISLACERRRKEIAVRKINGARVKDILRMFTREYLAVLVISAAIAFPLGYLWMNDWLEQYVKRTPVGVEIYLGIFLLLAILMALCTGWKVWRAAVANPAEVVKSE
ncbi:MAG: FtsX-like permease family protein [Bacteroides sp.]|nr:FtsX-like permease family protein [Bacteroides sp.]